MALPQTRPRSRVLTASASALDKSSSEFSKRRAMSWQNRALAVIDIVPELQYASRFYARMLKQLRIYPGLISPNGDITPTEDELPIQLLDRIQDPGGGRSQILGRYGELMFTTGEGLLFGRDLDSDDEQWSFVWTEELDIQLDGKTIRKIIHRPMGMQGDPVEYGPGKASVYRMWTTHPRLTGEATSPLRAGLDVAEELIALTQAVMATAVSRKTNGILLLASEMAPPPAEAGSDEDPLMDPFMQDLVKHLVAQTENAGTAEAAAPFIMWGASEFLPTARLLALHDTQNDYAERELRKEAVERLARGMDMPPEVLTGLSGSNHWAARQILDDMWRSHGAPIAEQFCDDLNQAYFRRACRDEGYADWKRIVIGYDESQIVVKPDRSEDADEALDRGAIGYRGYRAMKDIPEADAAGEDDLELMALIAKMKRAPASGRDGEDRDADQGPPEPGAEGDSGRRTRVVASAARELGAAEVALQRCREMAGSRIRAKGKGKLEFAQAVDGSANSLVASIIGADGLFKMNLEPREMVKGGASLLRPLLPGWGYTDTQSATICEMIELYAARTLFDAKVSLPTGIESQITQMKEAA